MTADQGPIEADVIRSLDAQTVDRIAAGEVVERPASVVKELVENSLDAAADRISVSVEAAGTEAIRVSDDGVGMTASAAKKAVERHTTSKLTSAADLEAGITTLGFRGEALHTIAAVSRLTLTTRPHETEAVGTSLTVEGGTVTDQSSTGCPPGTTVEVRDLFYNTPARQAFLRTETTEFDHVNRVVANYALANPEVAISLSHDGSDVFSTPGQGSLRGAVLAVYGHDVAEAMIDVSHTFEDGPVTEITGMVSDPETTRSRPRYLSTFVDGRYVRSDRLRDGILDAYGGQLAPDRYPFAVLHCRVRPGTVDVNVHPRKRTVKFESAETVTDHVSRAVREALLDAGLVRTTAARGRGAPAETSLSESWSPSDTADRLRGDDSPTASPMDPIDDGSDSSTMGRVRSPSDQRTITGETPGPSLDRLPQMRLLGQLDETFIVAESDDGLLLIDQHAADERIHFESLRERFRGDATSQTLIQAVEVDVTPDERAAFTETKAALATLGFRATSTDDESIRVEAVPTVIDTDVDPDVLRDAIASAIDSATASTAIDDVADAVLGDLACYPAVTGGTRLSTGSTVALLEALDDCENPYACPHGRPVLIRIDFDELADRFERDYPGHAERRPERQE